MSEYQVYQFKCIDRPLTSEEREVVGSLSSRARPTSTSITFNYSYSDFRHDEMKILEDYFDAFLYFSNWGTLRLAFRLPKDVIDEKAIRQYETEPEHSFETYLKLFKKTNCYLLEFYWAQEEGFGWLEEDSFELEDLLPIREDILKRDYRALYLFWLKLNNLETDWVEADESTTTPPLPSNLNKLSPALQTFIDYFEIDKDLVAAAQSASSNFEPVKPDYKKLILQLRQEERIEFLVRLAQGETYLDLDLRKRLADFDKIKANHQEQRITIEEIRHRSKTEKAKRQDEETRLAQKAFVQKMETLAKDEKMHWKSVYFNLDRKTGKSYELATSILKDLHELAKYKNTLDAFHSNMEEIRKIYGRSWALIKRFEKEGLFN